MGTLNALLYFLRDRSDKPVDYNIVDKSERT